MRDYSYRFADGKAKAREVKQKWRDPHAVAQALGLSRVTPIPGGVRVRCLWHDDTNPSCAIQFRDGVVRVRCFACGHRGDVLDLAAAVLKLSTKGPDFQRVLEHLTSLPLPAVASVSRNESGPQNGVKRGLSDAGFAVVAEALIELSPLESQPDVADYLANRRLLSQAKAEGWGALPQDLEGQDHLVDEIVATVGDEAWRASGLSGDGERLAFPQHRLVIPWRDPLGYAFNLQRRIVGANADSPKYVGCSGRQFTWPYGVEAVLDTPPRPIMFVEGAMDVLAARTLFDSERVALGIPGAAGWQPDWRWLCAGQTVFLAFDADAAGSAALRHVAASLHNVASSVAGRRPENASKDWAELLHSLGGGS